MKDKVFCIGFHKTGTTSLGSFLEKIGYSNCHGAGPIRKALGDKKMMELLYRRDYDAVFEIAKNYNSFNDNPWFFIYPALDEQFPGSKFILMTRNEKDWLKSCIQYFGNTTSKFRMFLYGKGSPIGNEERYLKVYRNHNEAVLEFFKNRPDDLLVIELEDPNKMNKIKKFLKVSSDVDQFPLLNSSN